MLWKTALDASRSCGAGQAEAHVFYFCTEQTTDGAQFEMSAPEGR
jgi:hypothetical protein